MRDTIAELLARDVKDPRVGFVTITRVLLTDDLRHARVLFSCLGDAAQREKSLAGLRSAAGFIKSQMTRRLKLRFAPELVFVYDSSLQDSDRMGRILRQEVLSDEAEQDD